MKNFRILLSVILITMFICGCSNPDETTPSASETIEDISSEVSNAISSKEIIFTTQYDIVECYNGCFIATTDNGNLYGMLNQNGDVAIDFIYKKLTFGSPKNNNMVYATNENGQGVLDFNGNVVIPLEYNKIKEFEKYNTYTFATKDDVIYAVYKDNTNKKINATVIRNDIEFLDPLSDSCYMATVSSQERIIYDFEGNTLASYKGLHPLANRVGENYICVQETIYNQEDNQYSTKMSFYDTNFNLCSTSKETNFDTNSFAITDNVNEEVGVVKLKNDEYALIEYATGNIISDKYIGDNSRGIRGIESFVNGKTFAKSDNGIIVLDENGKESLSLENPANHRMFTQGIAIVGINSNYNLYNINCEKILSESVYNYERLSNNYLIVENVNSEFALFNPYGEMLYDFGNISANEIYGKTKSMEYLNEEMYCAVVSNGVDNTVYIYMN